VVGASLSFELLAYLQCLVDSLKCFWNSVCGFWGEASNAGIDGVWKEAKNGQ